MLSEQTYANHLSGFFANYNLNFYSLEEIQAVRKEYEKANPTDFQFTLEEGLEKGIIIRMGDIIELARKSNRVQETDIVEIYGNVKDDDIIYTNKELAVMYPEYSKYVTNTVNLFRGCSWKNIDLSNHDFSNVWNASNMFEDCHRTVYIGLPKFSPLLQKMDYTFANCRSIERIDLSPIEGKNMSSLRGTFIGCGNLLEVDFEQMGVDDVEDLSYCFQNCEALRDVKFGDMDVTELKAYRKVFDGCDTLKSSFINDSLKAFRHGTFSKNCPTIDIDLPINNSEKIFGRAMEKNDLLRAFDEDYNKEDNKFDEYEEERNNY